MSVPARARVCLVSRDEPGTTGTSRYVGEIAAGLSERGYQIVPLSTRAHGAMARLFRTARWLGPDLGTFLASYPLLLAWPEADVYHLTGQTYASALLLRRPRGPVVVTVHDIIPYLTRNDPQLTSYGHPLHRLFDRLAMWGLGRADMLIADSAWTRETLVTALRIPADRISVVPLGVDRSRFRPHVPTVTDLRRLGLIPEDRIVLYVGSEDPRKNLHVLWRAFADAHRRVPQARLVKVGSISTPERRARLVRLGHELGIDGAVSFLDGVADADLPLLYSAADVVVLPTLYEGFGLPVLEALACGARVVCAATSSLPEVAGEVATLCPPTVEAFSAAIGAALARTDTEAARAARRAWATRFTWGGAARAVAGVYASLLNRGSPER